MMTYYLRIKDAFVDGDIEMAILEIANVIDELSDKIHELEKEANK